MSVSYSFSRFKVFYMVFSPVNLFNCSEPSCVCAAAAQGPGLAESVDRLWGRSQRQRMKNGKLTPLEIEQDDMIMSGEVNKWGVKAA